jgi:TRAP-type C4-dicarboxylate transport system substrate-binding protein
MLRKLWVLGLLGLIGGGPVQAREFHSSDVYPANAPTVQALAYMGTLIERETNGRHKLRPPEASDGDSEEFIVAQVRTGKLDIARVNLAVLNAMAPSTAVVSAPYLFKSDHALHHVLDGPIGDEILAGLEQHGLIGLCFYDVGARSLFTTQKPVRSPADLKGMRIRSQPGDLSRNFWRALGAEPIAMPYSRMSEALRAKVIEAATDNWVSFVAGGNYRLAKYFVPSEHVRTPGVLIFSRQVWQELDEGDRRIIRAAAKESAVRERQLMEAYRIEARRTVQQSGVTFVDNVDLNAFREAMTALYPDLFVDYRQQDLLERIQKALPSN